MEDKAMEKNQVMEIDLKRVLGLLKSKALLIALVSVVCAIVVLVGTVLFVKPKYETTVMFYINNRVNTGGSGSITSGDMSAARGLVESFVIIMNTRETLLEVADRAGLNYSYGKMLGMVSAEAIEDTEILKVVVTSSDPAEAEAIADAITQVLPERSSKIVDGSSVKIVTGANRPTSPSSPSYPTSALIGFLIGFLCVVAAIVLRDVFDTTIRGEADVACLGDHPILASVPDLEAQKKSSRYYSYGKRTDKTKISAIGETVKIGTGISFAASEAYKLLRTKLLLSFTDDKSCHVIGITSSLAGEGKSMTAVNLAYSMSQLGERVLLIDCDMRRPSLAEKLPIRKTPGLSDYLSGQTRAETLIQPCGIQDDENAFHIISAGHTPPNPMELLSSKKMEKTLEQLRGNYDYIILDLPPVGEVGDALVVAGVTDGMLLVVRQGFCDRVALNNTLRQLSFVDCRSLGAVFNGTGENVKGRYYKYSRKYQRYQSTAEIISRADKAVNP